MTISAILKHGGLGVIPTDTIYGMVARARDRKAVARLYQLRRETAQKPFIILISSLKDLAAFGVTPNATALAFLKTVWPGKVSVILPCPKASFRYLHLGTKTLAFRMPKLRRLRALLTQTGPLVAPSANLEGKRPAETIQEARTYFGSHVDLYISGGRRLRGAPSTLVSLLGAQPIVVRQGAVSLASREAA